MKTHNLKLHPLAVLTASRSESYAILSAELSASEDGWVQLLPAGKFKARDGRPHDTEDGYWHIDADIAAAMIAATKATAPKILIDYDHQTLRTEQNGQPAPASAWLNSADDIEWREGKGLYIRPQWTERAQKLIDDKEYAFLSAVFPYDKAGKPLLLRMAAITNDPGLVGLDPVAALAADINVRLGAPGVDINLYGQTEDSVLNEIMEKLLAKLGILVDGELTDELATAALSALDALQVKAGKADELESKVATLSAQGGQVDLAKFVPVETYNGLVAELTALKGNEQASVDSLVEDAYKDKKIHAAEKDFLKDFGKQKGVAELKALLENRPQIAVLSSKQTDEIKPPKQEGNKLSEAELAVLKACDLSKEDFLKAKESN